MKFFISCCILFFFLVHIVIAEAALCVVCHQWDMETVYKAMGKDNSHLSLHHEYFYASVIFANEPNSFQQVVWFVHKPFV